MGHSYTPKSPPFWNSCSGPVGCTGWAREATVFPNHRHVHRMAWLAWREYLIHKRNLTFHRSSHACSLYYRLEWSSSLFVKVYRSDVITSLFGFDSSMKYINYKPKANYDDHHHTGATELQTPSTHKTNNSQKTTSQISLLPRNSSVTTVASSWREISAFNSARDLKTEPIDSEIFLRSLRSLGFDSPNDLNIIVYNEWKYWDLQLDHTCKKWNHVWKLLATRSFTSFSLNLPRKLVDTHDARMDAIHELHQIRNDLHSLTSSWVLDTCIMHEHIQR